MNPALSIEPPKLPSILAWPLGVLPANYPANLVASLLNRLLMPQLRSGELNFLIGKRLRIRVTDAYLNICLSVEQGLLRACPRYARHHVQIEGGAYTFLQLATRREDPDTLFFNRQLRMNGDTELGLRVKNFLDTLEPEQFGAGYEWLDQALQQWEQALTPSALALPNLPILRITAPVPSQLMEMHHRG